MSWSLLSVSYPTIMMSSAMQNMFRQAFEYFIAYPLEHVTWWCYTKGSLVNLYLLHWHANMITYGDLSSFRLWYLELKSNDSHVVCVSLGVDFSYCWINLEEGWYSLEQYIGFEGRQAFNYYCSLHQVIRSSDLMKTTVVVESLSSFKTNVLFQRIPTFFKMCFLIWPGILFNIGTLHIGHISALLSPSWLQVQLCCSIGFSNTPKLLHIWLSHLPLVGPLPAISLVFPTLFKIALVVHILHFLVVLGLALCLLWLWVRRCPWSSQYLWIPCWIHCVILLLF